MNAPRLKFIFFLLLTLPMNTQVLATEIVLRPQAMVNHSIITLGDVAEVQSPNLQWVKDLQDIDLIPAPQQGRSNYLTLNDVRSHIQARGVDLKHIRLIGASRVKITHASSYQMKKLGSVATSSLLTKPKNQSDYQTSNVSYEEPMAVYASEPIRRGELIRASSLTMRPLSILQNKEEYFTQFEDLLGKEASRSLPAGRPIPTDQVQEATVIRKNQAVSVIARIGNITVRRDAIALADAGMNQIVLVQAASFQARGKKNEAELLNAVVKGPGEVEVINRP